MLKMIETNPVATVDVRVIGLGGAGCSTLNRLAQDGSNGLSMLAIDTGSAAQHLNQGIRSLTLGNAFGSGGNPDTAVEYFEAIESEVVSFIGRAEVVVVIAGLGRGTGSGLAPIVADLAKKAGALTVAAVNLPFEFEGRFRNQIAEKSLDGIQATADSVFAFDNNDLIGSGSENLSTNRAFKEADLNVANMIEMFVSMVESSPERFETVSSSLRAAGKSAVVTGSSSGLHAGKTAVIEALALISHDARAAKSVVLHVKGGIGLSLGQVAEVVTELRNLIGRQAAIHVSSERLIGMGQEIEVSIVVAGIGNEFDHSPELHQITGTPAESMISVFDTPAPVRTRGPVLLPTG